MDEQRWTIIFKMNKHIELWSQLIARYSRCSSYEDGGITLSSATNSSQQSREEYRFKTLFVRDTVLDVKYVSRVTNLNLDKPIFVKQRYFYDFNSAPRTMWSVEGETHTQRLKFPVAKTVGILNRITFVPGLLLGLPLNEVFGFSFDGVQENDRHTYELQSSSGEHRLLAVLQNDSAAIEKIEFQWAPRAQAESSLRIIQVLDDESPEAWLKQVNPDYFRDVTVHSQLIEYSRCRMEFD